MPRAVIGLGLTLALGMALTLGAPALAAPKAPPPPDKTEKPASPAAEIEAIEQLYAKLDYEQANAAAERILAKAHGLTHDQLVRTYKVLAVTHAVLDHAEPAKEAFIALLTYEPEYAVDPNLGPKVQTPFFEARGFWRAQGVKPGIEVASVIRGAEAGTLRVSTRDPTRVVRKVTVGYRWGSTGPFTKESVSVGDGVSVEVPAPPPGKARLDYYAQAVDDRESVLFEVGSAAIPRSAFVEARKAAAPVAEEKSASIFASPVFWIAAAAVVAGGVTGGYFAFRPGAPVAASYKPTLECGAGRCP